MDIDKNNWKSNEDVFYKRLKKADLIAIDLEFTGVRGE